MPYLELCAITKTYAKVPALQGIDLSFDKGQFTCILGPSGCGKTTLLHILAGIIAPSGGCIRFHEKDITRLGPEHRAIGMVFQNYALFPNLTVQQNIAYGLHGKGLSSHAQQERVKLLLDLVGLSPFARKYPQALSGGQQQRVALARALAPSPSVLLLDEPLSALDAKVRETLGQELLHIQRQTGVTAVMVTHDQTEALALAERIVVMNKGRVEQDGSPDDLYERPQSRFVAEFIGHMNIIPVALLVGAGGGQLDLPLHVCEIGIRFEEVQLAEPSEYTVAMPHTLVARVEHRAHMGTFFRFELLLSDYQTRIFADIPRHACPHSIQEGSLVAATLPRELWRVWEGSPATAQMADASFIQANSHD